MVAYVIVGAAIAFIIYCSVAQKQHEADIAEVHEEYHYARMLKLSYKEDRGEKLTVTESRELEAARAKVVM
ncbi:hypothetical protein LCGC14_2601210 [marine sediment metagenome]|uniref:Uncharacterized protein n=1 Tax=marine sediment metagenome TaxID=412755 RepID=A0A0F9A8M2_9ZZZZ